MSPSLLPEQLRRARRQQPSKCLARERERARRLERRLAHAVLAGRLLAARRPEARVLIAMARTAVDRWERERLCSRHYIKRWRAMLAGPVERVARALLEPTEWTDALFQTTPWAFALEPGPMTREDRLGRLAQGRGRTENPRVLPPKQESDRGSRQGCRA